MIFKLEALLKKALAQNKIELDLKAQQKLLQYLELIKTWNQVFNLTTILTPRDMVYLHLVDSLAVQPFLHGKKLLDVGSGAGLPGIPLAIANPLQEWVLLDKTSKKTRFLTQVVAELGLTNVEVIASRVEDFHPDDCFDSILSRAFATLTVFIDVTAHLLCANGVWIAMKGKYPEEELHQLSREYQADVSQLDIKGMDIERHIVCLKRKESLWEK